MNEIRFSTSSSLNSQCEVYGSNKDKNSHSKIIYSNHQKEEIFLNNRIEQIKDSNVEVNRTIESKRVKNSSEIKSVNTEKQKIIGNRAEFFFNTYLKTKFGDTYNELLHWKSPEGRKYYLNDNTGCDDSLGYDFVVEDHLKLFSDKKTKQIQIHYKTCFIEVKGCSGAWDGTFFISENEKQYKDSEIIPETQSYIIVVIENVDDYSNIGIAAIINWTENNNLVRLEPNSFLATYASIGEQWDRTNNDSRSRITGNRNKNNIYSNSNTNNHSQYRTKQGVTGFSENNGEWDRNNNDSRSRITDKNNYSPCPIKRGVTGTFKYYCSNGGFIICDDANISIEYIFFHSNRVLTQYYLQEGNKVIFDLRFNDRKQRYNAINVQHIQH